MCLPVCRFGHSLRRAAEAGAFRLARFVGGLAIGSVSVVSPLYIAEVSPEKIRGRLVALYQLAIVLGIVLVFFVNWRIQRLGDVDWNVDYGWRWMMGSLTLPAVLFGILLLPVPESPRWLMKSNRREEAEDILVRIGGQAAGRLGRCSRSNSRYRRKKDVSPNC